MATGLAHRTARRSHRPDPRTPVVVVGSGRSGSHFVRELLQCDGSEQFCITMLDYAGLDPQMPAAPCIVFSGTRVVRIDRFAKVVLSDDGRVTPYEVLVLALGSGRGLDLAVVDEEAIYAIGACAERPGKDNDGALLPRGTIRNILSFTSCS